MSAASARTNLARRHTREVLIDLAVMGLRKSSCVGGPTDMCLIAGIGKRVALYLARDGRRP